MSADFWLRTICASLLNAVIFGAGATLVLTVPALSNRADSLLPLVVIMAFVGGPLLSGPIARRMRLRNWGKAAWNRGDAISG